MDRAGRPGHRQHRGASSESLLGPLALSNGVVVAGGGRMVAGPDLEGAVRAYDQKSGTLLWSKQIPTGDFTQVAAVGKVAYAATTLGVETDPSLLLIAYDLFTGDELWSEPYGLGPEDPQVRGLAASGQRVAVVGLQLGVGPGNQDWLVRVHDGKTGDLVWDDVFDEAGGIDYATCAAIKGQRLYVGGTQTPEGGDSDGLLRAYLLKNGDSPWSHSAALAGDQQVLELALSGGTVATLSLIGAFDYFVRSHVAKTGAVKWDTELGLDPFLITNSFALNASRAIVGTDSGTFAFDAKTGDPVWDAPFVGFGATILGKRVFIPGEDAAAAFPVK